MMGSNGQDWSDKEKTQITMIIFFFIFIQYKMWTAERRTKRQMQLFLGKRPKREGKKKKKTQSKGHDWKKPKKRKTKNKKNKEAGGHGWNKKIQRKKI